MSYRSIWRKANARANQAGVKSEPLDLEEVWQRGKLICYLCGSRMSFDSKSLDHVIPLCKSGNNFMVNVAFVHPECNANKNGDNATQAQLLRFLKQLQTRP